MLRRFVTGILLTGLVGCWTSRPHVIISIEDPADLTDGGTTLAVGFTEDSMRTRSIVGMEFPISLTITAKRSGTHTLLVEVRDIEDIPIASATREIELRPSGGPAAVILLGAVCSPGEPDGASCIVVHLDDAPGICVTGRCAPSVCGDWFVAHRQADQSTTITKTGPGEIPGRFFALV